MNIFVKKRAFHIIAFNLGVLSLISISQIVDARVVDGAQSHTLQSNDYYISLTNDTLGVFCKQEGLEVICEYRTNRNELPIKLFARFGDTDLPISIDSFPIDLKKNIAVLFLVDTSDSSRQEAIDSGKKHIIELIEAHPAGSYGIASFDKGINIEAPIGSDIGQLIAATESLQADGLVTELYRSLLQGLDRLKDVHATCKLIFLLSDGIAEDSAYFHQDVVKLAKKLWITIDTVGYPRSDDEVVALQVLRRLSEETGGHFFETVDNYQLPQDFEFNACSGVRNSGMIKVDLSPIQYNRGRHELQYLELMFYMPSGINGMQIPLNTSVFFADGVEQEQAITKKQQIETVAATITPRTNLLDIWWRYVISAILLVVFCFFLFLIYLFLRQLRKKRKPLKDAVMEKEGDRALAYLQDLNNPERHYTIINLIWRIGRGPHNEMVLPDLSVSRRHAEIHRLYNGKFILIDLGSANGVYLNKEPVLGKQALNEGDRIDIGDFTFLFTMKRDYLFTDETILNPTDGFSA